MTITTTEPLLDRNEAIALIKASLRARSDRTWSVTGGRGTSWGWITITAPPARRDRYDSMTDGDRAELSRLLDETVHHQGQNVPASAAYRREYVNRAAGRPFVKAEPYWD